MLNEASVSWRPGRYGAPTSSPGLLLSLVQPATRICVAVHRDRRESIESRAKQAYGLLLPAERRFVIVGGLTCAWAGAGRWLFESSSPVLLDQLGDDFGAGVSLVDQSCSSLSVEVHGDRVRSILGKGVPIDLHPTAFGVGDIAFTLVGHIDMELRQIGGEPRYRLSVSRSYFTSFLTWLTGAAAEFGYEVAVSPTWELQPYDHSSLEPISSRRTPT